MSAEIPTIPNITAESNQTLTESKLINKDGNANLKGEAMSYLTSGGSRTVNGLTVDTYEFNNSNRAEFRKNMGKNVLATLAGYSNEGTLMDGPGTGFNSIESYYNNILRKEGDPELEIGNAEGTSLSKESLDIVKNKMLDKLEERFENSIPKDVYRTPKQTITRTEKNEIKNTKTASKLGETLKNTFIPTFPKGFGQEGGDDSNVSEIVDKIRDLAPQVRANLKSRFTVGDYQGFEISGPGGVQILHSGMIQKEIKRAILAAQGGLSAEQINAFDFNLKPVIDKEIDKLAENKTKKDLSKLNNLPN